MLRGGEEDFLDVEVNVYLDVGYFEGGSVILAMLSYAVRVGLYGPLSVGIIIQIRIQLVEAI